MHHRDLALYGGTPVRRGPFPQWPYFSEDEVSIAGDVLRSGKVNYWTGNEGRLFESEFATSAGCKYAVALANGTVALELSLHVLRLGPGDEVIVTSRTFIASASAVVMRGAIPVMADIDPVSQNITAESVRAVISPRTRAIITVHMAGWPCDMDSINAIAKEYGLTVIEDCAQCHGATYKGCPVGSLADVAAFSFCQDKIMTTGGEGGMLTTNDEALWRMAWEFKDHGKSWDAVYKRQHPPGFRWLHDSFGTNWRLTEMQSAIGRLQLRKLQTWKAVRQRNAAVLTDCFSKIPSLRVTVPPPVFDHAFYKYYLFVRPDRLKSGWDRDLVMAAVNAEGVPCFSGSCSEIYMEKAFEGIRPAARLPVARELGETSLMFLVHPTLQECDIADTCRAVEKVMTVAGK